MPCKPENKSYFDSYEVTVDSVRAQNPNLGDHEIKVRAARIFRPKFIAWREAGDIENKGEKEYENGQFSIDANGKMYFPKTGESVEQMIENQRRLSELRNNPSEFSVEDSQISLLIQEALRSGATRVVTSFGRTDGKNRDILEYTYDPSTNKGSIHVINTELSGNFYSYDEIKNLATSKFSDLSKAEPKDGMFILTDTPISERVAKDTIDVVHYAGKQTVNEVRQSIRSVQRYVENKKIVEARSAPITQVVKEKVHVARKMSEKAKQINEKIKTEIKKPKVFIENIVKAVVLKRVVVEKAVQVKDNIVRTVEAVKQFIERPRFEQIRKSYELMKKTGRVRVERVRNWITKKRSIRELLRRVFVVAKKENKVTNIKSIKKESRTKEKVSRLFTIAKNIIRTRERLVFRLLKRNEKIKKEQKHIIRERVVDVAVAIRLWFFLAKPKERITHEMKVGKKELKRLFEREPTAWILLAIIWQLAMIREMALPKPQMTKNKKTKRAAAQYTLLPSQGVIFAYAT